MSYIMSVFLREDGSLPAEKLVEFIEEGEYFETTPSIKYARAQELEEGDWRSIDVVYEPNRRPIVFWNYVARDKVADSVREAAADLAESRSSPASADILRRLRETTRVIAIEVFSEELTEEAWDMIDHLEHHLLKTYGGVLYALNEGFYILQGNMLQQVVAT